MSKKDYEAIAEAIAFYSDVKTINMVDLVAIRLCAHFAKDNPRFDRAKFLLACKIPVE